MVTNAVDSCTESGDSLPLTNNCQVSSCNKFKCFVMLIKLSLSASRTTLHQFAALPSSKSAQCELTIIWYAESCHRHAECVLALSVQMCEADDRQARALVPEGPADDEATTGQQAATSA